MSNVIALIMAAGSGDRFGETRKQFSVLGGHAMVQWSVRRIASAGLKSIVLAPPGHEDEVRQVLSDVHAVVAGGNTRQESVWNGLQALPEGTTHVLVHDAARPCLTRSLLDRILNALETHDAVVPAVPAVDTLVRERDSQVDTILERADVAGVQTPQGFAVELLRRAHAAARDRGFESSDDGSLVVAIDEPVHTVLGERTNIKVTFPEDVLIAESILRSGID